MSALAGAGDDPGALPGCAVLHLRGEIDATTLLGFRGEADVLVLDDTVHELVVDFSGTTLLDWTGFGLLVHLQMLARDNAITLVLRAIPPSVRALLARSGLDRVLDIREG